jgi:hypothetical protein
VNAGLSISDAYLIDLKAGQGAVTILKENDHLLRRFGQVDFIELSKGEQITVQRAVADEVWAVVGGEAAFDLEDQREQSPTNGVINTIKLAKSAPKALLVPFGVACKVSTEHGGRLVRISTHEDGTTAGDQTL